MKLSALVEALQIDEEEVIITKNGRAAAVLVSPSEYESWQETRRVQSDAELMAEIQQGLDALKDQHVPLYTLEELFEEHPQDGR
ncbi:MAG: prevent-host-death protein [Candidatus Entotheonella factor]|uniref:Antitoxin n=2 Tax=Candidatus Entotheonella TaxID=93171 RepID=W4M061_ENTF1|nr:MAG: prevent-host-death protein [Candidatus Entotheonella factor]